MNDRQVELWLPVFTTDKQDWQTIMEQDDSDVEIISNRVQSVFQNPMTYGKLEVIKEKILFGDPSVKVRSLFPEIIGFYHSNSDENSRKLVASCIRVALDTNPQLSKDLISDRQIIVGFANILGTSNDYDFLEDALHVIDRIFSINCTFMLSVMSFPLLVQLLKKKFGPIERRIICNRIFEITQNCIPNGSASSLDMLLEYVKKSEKNQSDLLTKAVNNIGKRATGNQNLLLFFLSEIKPENDKMLLKDVFLALSFQSKMDEYAKVIISYDIDFRFYLLTNNISNVSLEYHCSVLSLILALLPSTPHIQIITNFPQRNLAESNRFALIVQPILYEAIIEMPLSIQELLKAFLMTLFVSTCSISDDFVFRILVFSSTVDYAPYIASILAFYSTDDRFIKSCLLKKLFNHKDSVKFKKWYSELLASLGSVIPNSEKKSPRYVIKSLQDCANDLATGLLNPFEFLCSGIISKIIPLCLKSDSSIIDDMGKEISHLLKYIHFSYRNENVTPEAYNVFLGKKASVLFSVIGQPQISKELPVHLSLSSLLFYPLNLFSNNGAIESIFKAPHFSYLRNPQDDTRNPDIIYALISSSNNLDHLFSFESTRAVCSAKNFVSDILFMNSEQSGLPDLTIDLIIRNGSPINIRRTFPKYNNGLFLPLLDLLLNIHAKTDQCYINNYFVSRVKEQFSNPISSLGHMSPCFDLINRYSFLFPFEIRLMSFKMECFSPINAFRHYIKEYCPNSDIHLPSEVFIRLRCSRDKLFEHGADIIRYFFANNYSIDISFDGEEGVGRGPTKEFFSQYSFFYKLKTSALFRNTSNEGIYCYDNQGLFPSPNLSEFNKYFEMGIFVAKAILSDCVIDLDFNPAFFRLVRGVSINLEDIDSALARSLQDPDQLIGLDTSYPGIDGFKVIADLKETITRTNVRDYIYAVKDLTLNRSPKLAAEYFKNGFEQVFSFQHLDIFSESEICEIVSGRRTSFTIEELERSINISHGYEKESPEIRYLFEVISEYDNHHKKLFLRFVTGLSRIPIGGLEALTPRISVIKKDTELTADSVLPTASVCTSLLKLPLYSSKEILRNKLTLAIEECQNSFYII